MRISQENEDSQRTASHQPKTPSRTKTTLRLRFPKEARLRSKHDYRRVLKANRRLQGHFVSIHIRIGESPRPRLGITVSKKYGKAHLRNRFKRLVREAFRESIPLFPRDLEINVAPRSEEIVLTKQGILEDFSQLYAQPAAKKSR